MSEMCQVELSGLLGKNLKDLEDLYCARWHRYGVSPLTLGWTKGKQDIRFKVLLSGLPVERHSILDVGCGFGDLNLILSQSAENYEYFGIDLVSEFIENGKRLYGNDNVSFMQGDFYSIDFIRKFDYILGSGIFAFELDGMDNYTYIEQMLTKMFLLCDDALSVDFLSDRVNFKREHTFYANPSKVLDIALGLTRNVRLRHDYMPFEFAVTLFKDDTFLERDTIFNRHKNEKSVD